MAVAPPKRGRPAGGLAMSNDYYPASLPAPMVRDGYAPYGLDTPGYPIATLPRPDGCAQLAHLALLGAVVGGAVATARNLDPMLQGELPATRALTEVGRTALSAGVATALAGAAAAAITEQGPLRLGILFATSAAALYALGRFAPGKSA